MHTHTNLASGYRFKGGNALLLEQAFTARGFTVAEWATLTQASRLGKKPKPKAQPVTVILNDDEFLMYNTADLCALGTVTAQPRATFDQFKAQVIPHGNRYHSIKEARAFFAGIENTAVYTVNCGLPRGDFIHAALRFLADNGDGQGNRYSLDVQQIGWAILSPWKLSKRGAIIEGLELHRIAGMTEEVPLTGEPWEPRLQLTLTRL